MASDSCAAAAWRSFAEGSAHVERHVFKCAVTAATGRRIGKRDIAAILRCSNCETFTFEDFDAVVQAVQATRDADSRLRELYRAFDPEGVGFIRREDAIRIVRDAAPSVRTFEEAFDELDIRGTGRVSCEAFMMALRPNKYR